MTFRRQLKNSEPVWGPGEVRGKNQERLLERKLVNNVKCYRYKLSEAEALYGIC